MGGPVDQGHEGDMVDIIPQQGDKPGDGIKKKIPVFKN
jgi:hypothetical protein